MHVLVITKVFPNACEPHASAFNRQQFSALSQIADVQLLATIPWFPGARWLRRWSAAGRLCDVPDQESIDGMLVSHPRVLYVPGTARSLSGPLYTLSLAREVLSHRGRFDVVLGAWAYPDGWAAIQLARALDLPSVVKLHGSDVNVVGRMPGPRAQLRFALPRATRIVAVSRPLAERAIELGVAPDRVDLVPNGVDRALFYPRPRAVARAELGLPPSARIALYVGRLELAKGVADLLAAFAHVAASDGAAHLALVGDGALRTDCRELAARQRCRVTIAGAQPLREIPRWLAACDLLVLPSWNEGTPNVLLEAIACGRRVVATDVGGIPDIVDDGTGELVPRRDPAALADALARGLRARYDPAEVARRGRRIDWRESALLLRDSLARAIAAHTHPAEVPACAS